MRDLSVETGRLPQACRHDWPDPRGMPTNGGARERVPARAPALAWQPHRQDAWLWDQDQADRSPWRHADRRAQRRRRWQRIAVTTASALLLTASSITGAVRDQIVNLSSDLHEERRRNVTLADSVAWFHVALDERIQRSVSLQPRTDKPVALPIAGTVSSGFTHKRLHPILRIWRPHRGIDIPAASGTPVRPVVDGRVLSVGRDMGYGLFVDVDHGQGIRTRYAHLQHASVQRGQDVTPETIIGEVGSSGLSSAPHLHYELMQHDRHLDPLAFAMVIVEVVPSSMRRVADRAPSDSLVSETLPSAQGTGASQ